MSEELAIKIFKQADLEADVVGCESCPIKDKNKTCIGCLDEAKDVLLNHTDNLQNRIDKAIEFYERNQQECVIGRNRDEKLIKEYYLPSQYSKKLLDILKGDDE